jgi:hypothetical protein
MSSLAALVSAFRLALDPAQFSRSAGIEPDDWQAEVLRSRAPRMLLNASRQSGKSTTAATLAVHTAIYEPGALVLLLSPTLRQSAEIFRKCLDVWQAVGRPVEAEAENKLSLELDSGSRIISLPGKEGTIRGYSGVRLLVVDEASRVPDDLYRTVEPMLAVSSGTLLALSTPWGKRGWWYEAWAHGGDAWKRWEVPATRCPRISAEYLTDYRRRNGDLWYRQEFLCSFEESASALFSEEDVQAVFSEEVKSWSISNLVALGRASLQGQSGPVRGRGTSA